MVSGRSAWPHRGPVRLYGARSGARVALVEHPAPASHMARVCFLWWFVLWDDRLCDGHPPPVHDLLGVLNMPLAGQPPSSQRNPATYRAIDPILARLDEGLARTQEVLGRHTVAQAQQLTTMFTPAPHVQTIMGHLQHAHPQGFAPSPTDGPQWIVSLEQVAAQHLQPPQQVLARITVRPDRQWSCSQRAVACQRLA